MEQSEIWQVYQRAWIVAGTGISQQECQAIYDAKYAGNLRDDDWRITDDALLPALEIRVWSGAGVFKFEVSAQEWAELVGGETKVVIVGSPEEQALLDYGSRKLSS